MSRPARVQSDLIETAREYSEEIEAAASKNDAPAGIVILDAYARGQRPPEWALEELEERL